MHLPATWLMVGIVWFVQLVHYPLFNHVPPSAFGGYESANIRLTAWMVGPPMIVEATTGLLLLWRSPTGVRKGLVACGAILLALIWVSTALGQLPLHRTLTAGFDPRIHRLLLLSNWVRTGAWSARGLLVLRMAWEARR